MLQTKLFQFTCKEIIDIFTIYHVRHFYCTFWLFAPKLSIILTEVGFVTPKIDTAPPLSISFLSSSIIAITVQLPCSP